MNQDPIIEKIKKLLEVANASGEEVQQAAAAMALANKLMLKHNLELHQIDLTTKEEKQSRIVQEFFELEPYQNKHEANWAPRLFNVIARHNMCKVIHHQTANPNKQGQIAIIGLAHNVQIVYYMCDQILHKIKIAEKRHWKLWPMGAKRNAFKRGFLIGAVDGIANKLREEEILRERMQNADLSPNASAETLSKAKEAQSMGLMIISNSEAIEKFVREVYSPGGLKSGSARQKSYSAEEAKAMGFQTGRNMQLHKGMGNSSAAAGLLN